MSNVFQTCLEGLKLKKMVVEQKTAQPVEQVRNHSTYLAQLVKECKNLLFLLERLFNQSRLSLNR